MLLSILYVLYVIIIVILIVSLLLSGVRPTKTLAWLMVLIFVPIIGIILYLSLGINRRKFKFFRIVKTLQIEEYLEKVNQLYHSIEEHANRPEIRENLSLVKLIIKNSNFLPSRGNKVQILVDGKETFDAIFTALREASKYIYIQYYIFENGDLADEFAEICKQKVKEGIEVKLLYDGVGSRYLKYNYLRELTDAGIKVEGFMPLHWWAFTTWINYRNRRKIVVVDGRIGFLGGINVSDKYIKGDPVLGQWHDHHLRLEGPSVESLDAVFSMDWNYATGSNESFSPPGFEYRSTSVDKAVQIVFGGPDSDYAAIRQLYFKLINDAKDYIYLANSYLIPGESIIEALQTTALSGVDVRIMLPEKSESAIVKWSMRSYFEHLLQAGVNIYLYQEGFLHSKTIVADDIICSVGTANLDIRSFEQNFEINAAIYDREIAIQLKNMFLEDCNKCVKIDPDIYRMRPVTDRLKEGLAKMISPVL